MYKLWGNCNVNVAITQQALPISISYYLSLTAMPTQSYSDTPAIRSIVGNVSTTTVQLQANANNTNVTWVMIAA